MNNRLMSCLPVILIILLAAGSAQAIPAFTRANNVECSTCHTIFPELNEYGEAFLKNGYVYFGKGKKKSTVKPKAASTSVEAKSTATTPKNEGTVKGAGNEDILNKLKAGMMVSADTPVVNTSPAPADDGGDSKAAAAGEPKSEGLLISGIPEQLPISFTGTLQGTYDHTAVNQCDLSTRVLKLNGGGHFKEKAAFFGSYVLYTEGSVGTDANTSTVPTNLQGKNDIGELFFIWRHAMDTPVNVKVGRFQPKLGLWKTNNKLSTTNSYATYAYTVGPESLYKIEQLQDAVEANMLIGNRLFIAGGSVNRKNQNTKEWYAHSSVKFGGADYLANEPEIDLNKEENILDFLTLTVGGYGYLGKNGDPKTITVPNPPQNKFYRAGVDIDVLYKIYRLKMSGVVGNDDNPDLTYLLPAVKTYVAAIEGDYSFLQNLIGAIRFEYQDDSTNKLRRIIPILAYTPIENVKVVAEYKYEYGTSYTSSGTSEINNKVGTLGVTFGF